jgi:hypothetical protein
MASVEREGAAADAAGPVDFERSVVLEQLESLEQRPRKPRWAWVLIALGLVAVVGLTYHGYTAYTSIDAINGRSKIETPNPAALFQEVATNGPRVGSTVENSSRATYGKALEQFVLDGTGMLLGVAVLVGGLLVRLNR